MIRPEFRGTTAPGFPVPETVTVTLFLSDRHGDLRMSRACGFGQSAVFPVQAGAMVMSWEVTPEGHTAPWCVERHAAQTFAATGTYTVTVPGLDSLRIE